jgi:hypothetical protein
VARVIDPSPPSTGFRLTRVSWRWVALAAAVVVSFVMLTHLLSGPRFVRTVTVVNTTEYAVGVTVSGADSGGAMPLVVVSPRSTIQMRDVVDQGPVWRFAFASEGQDAGDLVLSRDRLRKQGWRVDIPFSVSARLHELRVTPGSLS